MTNTTEEPQREKSASSPAAIAAGEEGFIGKETPLRVLCWQFLTSMYGNHQTAEFWRRCVSGVINFREAIFKFSGGDRGAVLLFV